MKTTFNQNQKIINYGSYDILSSRDNKILKTELKTTITENDFYKLWLRLYSIKGDRHGYSKTTNITIAACPIELMAYILCKDLQFNIVFKNGNELMQQIANDLNRTPASIYKSYVILKKKKYLVKSEDGLIIPNLELNLLQKSIKNKLKYSDHVTYDFIFDFCISSTEIK